GSRPTTGWWARRCWTSRWRGSRLGCCEAAVRVGRRADLGRPADPGRGGAGRRLRSASRDEVGCPGAGGSGRLPGWACSSGRPVKRAIVVVTDRTEGAVGWHEDLAHSLRTCIYRIETYRPSVPQVAAGGLELQAWLWAAAHHDEFVLLPQRALVKDWAPLKQAFEEEGMGVSFADQPWPFGHFLGKYVSVHLRQLLAPTAL